MLCRTKRTIALVLMLVLALPTFVLAEDDMTVLESEIDIEDTGIPTEDGDLQEELILDDIELSLEPPVGGTGLESELLETTLATDIDGEIQIKDPGVRAGSPGSD